jgi:hypothetical protein
LNLYEQIECNFHRNDDAKVGTLGTLDTSPESLGFFVPICAHLVGTSVGTNDFQAQKEPANQDLEPVHTAPTHPINTENEGYQPIETVCTPDYADLERFAEAGKTDLEVHFLDAACFLFALNLVRNCPEAGFMDMGSRYVPFWRKRLAPEAWVIVKAEIKTRLQSLKEVTEGKAA